MSAAATIEARNLTTSRLVANMRAWAIAHASSEELESDRTLSSSETLDKLFDIARAAKAELATDLPEKFMKVLKFTSGGACVSVRFVNVMLALDSIDRALPIPMAELEAELAVT